MKKHKNNIFQNLHFIGVIVLLFIFLLPNPIHNVNAAGTTPPVITSPDNNHFFNSNTVTVSGTATDDATPSDQLIMKISESGVDLSPLQFASDGTWTFTKDFSDGNHTVTVEATDADGNISSLPITFTVDKNRPIITEINVDILNKDTQFPEPINLLTYGDVTKILVSSKITVTVSDNYSIDNPDITAPFTLFSKNSPISGTTTFDNVKQQFVFTPSNLSPSTSYYLIVNPKLIDLSQSGSTITDNAGNTLFPKILKFTTTSTDGTEEPHGDYTTNTNTCANCHSTHVGSANDLAKQSAADNYCMACHDGTSAPLPENMDANHAHKHDNVLDPSQLTKAGSCTQCHDPHLNWAKENPNRLKDHYVYQHTNEPEIGLKDSQTDLCENCHGMTTPIKKNNSGVTYEVYKYKNSSTATGVNSDYGTCLRCHNGEKVGIQNIKIFYDDPTSMHRITGLDGSPLKRTSDTSSDGHLPCNACHDTHGSKNIDMLKDQLGQENQKSFDTGTETTWSPSQERKFCMKCHNGSTTIDGVTGKSLDPALSLAHDTSSAEACSTCHGGTSRSFMEAAHAPKP